VPDAATSGRLLVAHDGPGDASIVDLATGEVTYVELGLGEPHEVAVSGDGRWGVVTDFGQRGRTTAVFDGHRAAVIDMRERRLVHVIDLGAHRGAHGVTFLPGTHRAVLTAQTSRTVVVVDAAAGRVVSSASTGAGRSHMVAVTGDGRTAYTTNETDGTVSRIDLAAGRLVARFPVADSLVEGISLTPDGRELWVGDPLHGTIRILDPATGAVRETLPGFAHAGRLQVSPDGRRALASDPRCGSFVVDVPSRRRSGALVGVNGGGVWAPDSRTVFAAADGRREVVVLDAERLAVIARHRLRARPHGVAWGPAR
jgi:DNA-binding beta-propeller fold protein YncE